MSLELNAFANACAVSPATLKMQGEGAACRGWLKSVYSEYAEPLASLAEIMAKTREGIIDRGSTCDFGDREGELLYLMIRLAKPEVVVEMSPCHGYSTGYILQALTDSGEGVCHSYEISESYRGKPIHEVIAENLPAGIDRDRWFLHVGDARQQDIPDADFLFIDSSHSVGFAAWYYEQLIPKARKMVMVHDILVPFGEGGRVPKAAFLGLNEQYYLLQALAEDQRMCFAAADMAGRFKADLPMFTDRYGLRNGFTERSIVFEPVTPGSASQQLAEAARRMESVYAAHIQGDRLGAVAMIQDTCKDETMPLFGKLMLAQLLPVMGYKHVLSENVYPDLSLNPQKMSVSELMATFELMSLNGDHDGIRVLLDIASGSDIDPIVLDYVRNRGLRPLIVSRGSWFQKNGEAG